MKSIMHEASSLAKAIEQGWEKAGNPTDFSIKILEKPQKNFFGLTTHPAKIALYFDERPAQRPEPHVRSNRSREPQREQRAEHRPDRRHEERHAARPTESRPAPRIERRPENEVAQTHAPVQRQVQQHEAQWSEAMISYVREWLGMVLPESLGKHVGFTVEPNNLYLRITFESPALDNHEKEKRLYASLSLLILEALKRKFRVGLRRHKIILTNG